MEFFQWTSAIQYFAQVVGFLSVDVNDLDAALREVGRNLVILILVCAALYVACLVLGGIGLGKMAKRENKKHAWMGFVPILNTWYAGEIAGEANFFGQKMRRAGLYAAIAEGIYCVVGAFNLYSTVALLPYSKVEIDTSYNPEGVPMIVTDPSRVPQGLRWLYDAGMWLQIAEMLLSVLFIVFAFVLFLALFRKYFARGPVLMTVICTLTSLRGVVLFAVRNNAPVDYDAYMRKRMEEAVRGRYEGPSGGPGRSGEGNGSGNGGGHDPFPDFGNSDSGSGDTDRGGSSDDPFSEFPS